ncbi:hypothetical protein [Chishuiella sp.]|uniref:hypothetical protein n=1 Tax=Chishuiella sp. TaxID=1969467 RepID=UPI0028AFF597|nr:hypothetical protein [Chishuiella sp.]
MRIEKRTFFIMLSIFLILFGFIFPFILPDKFYFDSEHIITDPFNEKGLFNGSYGFTMFYYSITGLSKLPFSFIAIIQLTILFYFLYKVGIPEKFSQLSIKNCLIYLAFVMIAMFIGQPSKEFITFIFIAIIVYTFQYNIFSFGIAILISSLFFFLFGYLFRPYFAFIPFISMAIYFITKIRFKNRWIFSILLGISVIVLLSLTYKIAKGDFLSQITRENINELRLNEGDANADTMIVSPIPITNIFTEAFATVYGFVTVNFPINALRFFYKPQVIAFVIWQLLMTWIIIVRFGYLLQEFPNRKKELWLMCILLSYFIIQGIFEPDLGSAIRHKIGILPLIYYLFYYDDFKRKI